MQQTYHKPFAFDLGGAHGSVPSDKLAQSMKLKKDSNTPKLLRLYCNKLQLKPYWTNAEWQPKISRGVTQLSLLRVTMSHIYRDTVLQ